MSNVTTNLSVTNRRSFLKQVAATATAGTVMAQHPSVALAETADSPAPEELSGYTFGGRVWIRAGERLFTCYRAEPLQKYPYFYPLVGPASGLSMTDETALPWPHHRSLFFGCDHVNGGNYWQGPLDRGQIRSHGPTIEKQDAREVIIADHTEWRQPGAEPVLEDDRRFSFTAPTPRLRFIDADITLRARGDVTIAKTNHSFFSLRAARDLAPLGGGELLNAHGEKGEKATLGRKAPWCGYTGTRLGVTESIVLMDHPGNPWSPCPWFTRDYGFISPTPFFWLDEKGWHLPAGQSIRLNYRVAMCEGGIEPNVMNRLYAEWAKRT